MVVDTAVACRAMARPSPSFLHRINCLGANQQVAKKWIPANMPDSAMWGAGVLTGVSLSSCEKPLFLKWRFGCYLFSNFTAARAVIYHLSKGGFFLEWSQVHLEAKTCNTFSRY